MTAPVLYLHHAADPWFNMAFDEWLLARAEQTPGFTAVRLYSWNPATITFGVNQRQEKAYSAGLVGETPVIRRVTGGRAIYHDPSELTYAIAAHSDDSPVVAWRGSRSESATSIARLLQDFLREVGIATEYARQSAAENSQPEFFHSAPCFASHARYELLGDFGKVAASAQRRLDHSFLQHGSLKLAGLAPHPALGSEGSGKELPEINQSRFESLARQFRAAFERQHGLPLTVGVMRDDEIEAVARRRELVRKNSLDRRDVIKQIEQNVSL